MEYAENPPDGPMDGDDIEPGQTLSKQTGGKMLDSMAASMHLPGRDTPASPTPTKSELKRANTKRKKAEKEIAKKVKAEKKATARANKASMKKKKSSGNGEPTWRDEGLPPEVVDGDAMVGDADEMRKSWHEPAETDSTDEETMEGHVGLDHQTTRNPNPGAISHEVKGNFEHQIGHFADKPLMPLTDSDIARAYASAVKGSTAKPGKRLENLLHRLAVVIDQFVTNAINDVVDVFGGNNGANIDLNVCAKFIDHIWEECLVSGKPFLVEGDFGFGDAGGDNDGSTVAFLDDVLDADAASLNSDIASINSIDDDAAPAAPAAPVQSPTKLWQANISPAPAKPVSHERAQRGGKLNWDAKRINEQLRNGAAGIKPKMNADSEQIKRAQNSQSMASDAKRVTAAGITGKVTQGDAQVSYYGSKAQRNPVLPGVIQFDGDNDRALIKAASVFVFFHKDVNSKLHATGKLKSEAAGTFMLRVDDGGTKLCISYIHGFGITHHVLSQDAADKPINLNVSAFQLGQNAIVGLMNCYTLEDVLDTLSTKQAFWPQPLISPLLNDDAKSDEGTAEVVNTKVAAKVHPEVAHMVKQRQQMARDTMDGLTITKASRKLPEVKPRLMRGTDVKQHVPKNPSPQKSYSNVATMGLPASGKAMVFKPVPGADKTGAPKGKGNEKSASVTKKAAAASKVGVSVYFHKDLGKKEAERLLLADDGASVSGKFLVRPNKKGKYATDVLLTVIYKGKATHHGITGDKGGKLSINKQASEFTKVDKLIDHLRAKQKALKWPVPLTEGIKPASEPEPVPEPEPEPEPEPTPEPEPAPEPTPEQPATDGKRAAGPATAGQAGMNDVNRYREKHTQGGYHEAVRQTDFRQTGKHSMDAGALDIRRGKQVGKNASLVHKTRDFVPQVNRPTVGIDSEELKRNKAAQDYVTQAMRATTHTGVTTNDGGDESFYSPKSEDPAFRKNENNKLLARGVSVNDLMDSAKAHLANKPIRRAVEPANPNKIQHGFEEKIKEEAEKKARRTFIKSPPIVAEPEPEPERAAPAPKTKKWSIAATVPHTQTAEVSHDEGSEAKLEVGKITSNPFGAATGMDYKPPEGKPESTASRPAPKMKLKMVETLVSHGAAPAAEKLKTVGKLVSQGSAPAAATAAAPAAVAAPEETPPAKAASTAPPFLHQGIKKSVADRLLMADGGDKINGKFLIRTKTEMPDPNDHVEYVLSVIYKGKPTHHTIKRNAPGDALVLNGNKSDFTNLAELVDHLKEKRKLLKWPVPLVEAVNAV